MKGTTTSKKDAGGVVVVEQPIFRKPNGKMAVPTTEVSIYLPIYLRTRAVDSKGGC